MFQKTFSKKLLAFPLILPQFIFAGGIWLYEAGTPDVNTAGAGRNAVANTAATALSNPAGMTRLDGSQIMYSLQPMYLDSKFSGSSTDSGAEGGNAGGFIPAGGVFYVHDYSEDVKFGLSLASYFGLGLDYDDSWMGRYYVTDTALMTLGLNPTVAYKVNEKLSIGAGLNILYATFNQRIVKRSDESIFELDSDDVAVGANLSFLYEFTPQTRIGAVYATKVDLEFKDVGASDRADLEMTAPQSINLSAYHEINPTWAIMATVGWQEWSKFGQATVVTDNAQITGDRNYDDTWHTSIGVHYRYSDELTLMSGIAYDSSPVEDQYRTVDLPLDEQTRYAFGGTYKYSETMTIGAGYELVDLGSAKINQDGPLTNNITGEYGTNYLHVLSFNVNYKF